ncbi:MAG: hypothetical protein WEA34_10755 [Gemmatimonadota bacterium]
MNSPRALFAAAAAIFTLTACDVPTEPPMFEPRWIVPVNETSLSVDELLPAGVTVSGEAFDVSVDPVSVVETLGDLCPDCLDSGGFAVEVPPFSGDFVSIQALPAEVLSAEVSGGSVEIEILNGFTFDPLDNGGSVTITIADDLTGEVLGEVVLEDPADDLPPNVPVARTLSVQPGSITGPIRATTSVDAQGGQTAEIDTSDLIEVTATVQSLLVSSVTVDVGSRTVTIDEQEIGLEDIEQDIAERIVEGSIILDIDNPFGVSLDGTIEIGSTSRSISITDASTSTVTLSYTGDELRSFIGQPNVLFSGSGVANGDSVTIRPGQVMLLEATLDFTILIG